MKELKRKLVASERAREQTSEINEEVRLCACEHASALVFWSPFSPSLSHESVVLDRSAKGAVERPTSRQCGDEKEAEEDKRRERPPGKYARDVVSSSFLSLPPLPTSLSLPVTPSLFLSYLYHSVSLFLRISLLPFRHLSESLAEQSSQATRYQEECSQLKQQLQRVTQTGTLATSGSEANVLVRCAVVGFFVCLCNSFRGYVFLLSDPIAAVSNILSLTNTLCVRGDCTCRPQACRALPARSLPRLRMSPRSLDLCVNQVRLYGMVLHII